MTVGTTPTTFNGQSCYLATTTTANLPVGSDTITGTFTAAPDSGYASGAPTTTVTVAKDPVVQQMCIRDRNAAAPNPIPPCGDGGLATAAALNGPTGVYVDASGNIVIGDAFGARVREIGREPALEVGGPLRE